MRQFFSAITVLILSLFTVSCFASEIKPNTLTRFNAATGERMGVSYSLQKDHLEIIINQRKALTDGVVELKKMGLVSQNVTQAQVNTVPTKMCAAIGLQVSAVAVYLAYWNTTADKLHVDAFIASDSSSGLPEKNLIFAYDFTRDLHNGIEWDKLSTEQLEKLSLNFHYSEWYSNQARNEPDA